METLITQAQDAVTAQDRLPFAVYTSTHEQRITNAPVINPVLIAVLKGQKIVGRETPVTCDAGHFIFLADSPSTYLRNVPVQEGYIALVIEFSVDDFKGFTTPNTTQEKHVTGPIDPALTLCLEQFINWATVAPEELWHIRRQEIIQLLYSLGYHQIPAMSHHTKLSHRIHNMLLQKLPEDMTSAILCRDLAMSESTLHRKLKSENTTLQDVKDLARMGKGLHLLQSTTIPIGVIAQECGYSSQSRFTDRFKKQFGLTPSELKKTQLNG